MLLTIASKVLSKIVLLRTKDSQKCTADPNGSYTKYERVPNKFFPRDWH